MTPLKFYYWFGIFVESFPLIPILFGLKHWRKLSSGFRLFMGFLMAELLLNCLSDYFMFALHRSNLFLFYFYSFFQNTFILGAFWHFFHKRTERLFTFYLWCFGIFVLVFDFIFVSQIGYNYLSNFLINCLIAGLSFYYFYKNFPRNYVGKYSYKENELIISAALVLQFFIRAVNIFLEKYLLATQFNAFLSIQIRNVYAYFMLLSLFIYTYTFYTFKMNEK